MGQLVAIELVGDHAVGIDRRKDQRRAAVSIDDFNLTSTGFVGIILTHAPHNANPHFHGMPANMPPAGKFVSE